MPETANPYIAGSPVTGSEMFFGREDVFTSIRQALTGQHRDHVIVLYGQRRSGKTSVLYQIRRHLDARYLPIFIDLHGLALNGLEGLLWELANHITRVLRREYQIDVPLPKREDFAADPRSAFEEQYLDSVWSALGDRHLLLMFDEAIRLQEQVQAGKLEKEVFEYLRHLMQHYERLNFLFSLGSGLEQMEKEYAFLFNVALYQKISFLSRDAGVKLITEPVKGIYAVEPAAVEYILNLTSGHPYYTQLLCHLLFNRAQQQSLETITPAHVDAVLEEGVERGLAVLKHPWDESTPAEKAVMAGMATVAEGNPGETSGHAHQAVTPKEIQSVWSGLGVVVPDGEIAMAVQRLIARDIIIGTVNYAFTVDLQRLWTQKFKRLEWVKEEIGEAVVRWSPVPVAIVATPLTAEQMLERTRASRPILDEAAPPAPAPPVRPARRLPLMIALGVSALVLVVLAAMAVYEIGRSSVPVAEVPSGSGSGVAPGGETAQVSALALAANRIWAATEGGLVRWDTDGNGRVFKGTDLGFDADCVTALVTAPDGSLWLGCGGVAHVRPNGDQLNSLGYYNRDNGLGMGVVRTLLVDKDGSVWAGGQPDAGSLPPLTHFDQKAHENDKAWVRDESLDSALTHLNMNISIQSLMRARDGALWIGLDEGGILRWDGRLMTHYGQEHGVGRTGISDQRIRHLFEDSNGTIWAAASQLGLLRFDGSQQKWTTITNNSEIIPIQSIAQFVDSSLWVGGNQVVAKSIDGGKTWAAVGDYAASDTGALVQDANGHVWAGAYSGGVSVWDGSTWRALQP